MSSASSIKRSSGRGGKTAGPRPAPPTRSRAVFTWLLSGLWLFLMGFAAVSLINPPWLQALTREGVESEYKDYKNYGDDALRQGNFPLAIGQYQYALEIHPDGVEVLMNIGAAWAKAGFPAKGEPYLRDALARTTSATSRGVIQANLAELADMQGRRDEALALIHESIAGGGELEKRYSKLGQLYLAGKDFPAALDAFEKALALQTDVALSYHSMLVRGVDTFADDETCLSAVRSQLGETQDEAFLAPYDLTTIRAAQGTDKRIAALHNYAGRALLNLQRFDEAGEHFQASLRIWPRNPNAEQNLTIIRQMKEDQKRQGAPQG